MSIQNKNPLTWQAWEFKYYEKTAGWYITVISLFILMIAFFLIEEKDIFAAVSLAIIGALVIFFSYQTPERVNIELNDKGVYFGNLFYPYKQLKYFWVVHNDRHQTINFHTTAMVNNTLILELEDQDPDVTRKFLLRHLAEHPATEETHVQKIMHKLKF